MANYLSLEEAAAKLGISTDRLVELRSQGQVRGFRDGSSWKFPDSEVDRLKDELAGHGNRQRHFGQRTRIGRISVKRREHHWWRFS